VPSLTYRLRRANLNRIESILALALIFGVIASMTDVLIGDRGLNTVYMGTVVDIFLRGMYLSLYITTASFALGLGIGFLVGWIRTTRTVPFKRLLRDFRLTSADASSHASSQYLLFGLSIVWTGLKYVVRRIMDGYVEIMRGTPLFVQIFFVWSIFIVFLTRMPERDLLAVLLAMTINTGGYQGEIFRGGLQTVHSGQVEAARALGLSRWRAMRYVVLPQTLRLITPPLTNEYIGLLKASALAFYFGVQELTYYAKQEAFSGHVFEAFILTSALYLIVTFTLAKVITMIERRYRIPGLGIQQAPAAGKLSRKETAASG